MTDTQLQLSWDSYQNNICKGLGLLQQRGEFVDMTIAADGHHVKVHQMILSLVSPFIKELITTAQCPHPVIFLNKVSYQTLQLILEYAYTGEVIVGREVLGEFLEACKSLHIKGLETDIIKTHTDEGMSHTSIKTSADAEFLRQAGARGIQEIPDSIQPACIRVTKQSGAKRLKVETLTLDDNESSYDDGHFVDDWHDDNSLKYDSENDINVPDHQPNNSDTKHRNMLGATIQYTLSCQGSIQIVVNRFIYQMRHTRKNNEVMWRCQDYNKSRCRAIITTKGDLVIERGGVHNHLFHDKQILKRVRRGNMFTGFNKVQSMASMKKKEISSATSKHDEDDGNIKT